MPRLKAITTGSVPSFLDVILNIAESDTSSTLAYQDTWLAQLKARGDRLVMYGDDTWLKLFPGMFDRADGTTSFFVSDFIEVDQNVTRHVAFELSQPDWSAFIMHYLGLDHIGHKAGPKSPFMPAKHREMDDVVNEVYSALQQEPHLNSTLFILCGDHGMNEAGNHGGSSAGETSPALLFISPKLEQLGTQLQSPIGQNGDFEYYRTVEQVDITPTLAGLLGLPISRNSLGIFIPEFLNMWDSDGQKLKILHRNARQLLTTVEATFPGSFSSENPTGLDCEVPASDIARAQCLWSRVHELFRETNKEMAFRTISPALHEVLGIAQNVMSSTASNYDVSRLGLGLLITTAAALLVLPTVSHQCARSYHAGLFLALMVIGYGAMMFASSYVEEEQQFWYWICSGWIFYLHIKSGAYKSSSHHGTGLFHRTNAATLGLLMAQRILRRWNQTGQKFAAEPDIAHTLFSRKPAVMWALVALTYMDSGYHFLQGLPAAVLPRLGAFVLPALALVFKMNFVANDSPELLADSILSRLMEAWPKDLSLVWQARLVFACLTCCSLVAIFNRGNSKITGDAKDLVHEVLHLFLITQSRVTNIPLFLLFRLQSIILASLNLDTIEVTITSIIFQYLTFFALGGSNAIGSVDLSSAYNGIGSYSVFLVGILTFASNWAGPIWWVSMCHSLRPQKPIIDQGSVAMLTFHAAVTLASVMAACTALRTHLFIWTVFSPKYLYAMVWGTLNHVVVNLLGGLGLAVIQTRK
ncbi:GPI ethanolamine phosphate transferase 2 [Penicillium chermesinum]|nr:GPI ethanolamine phosphate transferase 2 [Penicillium chermesinum]